MASFRPFPHPPPSSSFVSPPAPNQAPIPPRPLHPPVVSGAGHPYPQHGGFPASVYSAAAPPYQFGNPSAGQQHNQQQYAYPPPQPPSITGQSLSSSSFPPPPLPQPGQLPHPPYYPSSQYSYYNPPPQPPPPPPPPPSSPPIHSSSFPPPPPPPASPPPPPPPPTHPELPRKSSAPVPSTAPVPAHNSFRHQKPHPPHPGKVLLPGPGRVETEEERSARKRREYEKQRQEERRQLMLKQSQAKVLQKTQILAATTGGARASGRPHESMVGSRMGDRRTTPFLTGDRVENRLKKPTTFICKMKFRNELPDPTAQPKLLAMNTNKDRYTKYTITSLEKTYKPKLYPEPDLGIPLDLLDICVYNLPAVCPPLAPEDEELLRDTEVETPIKQGGIRKKERPTEKGVSWLVNTEYISSLSMDTAKTSMSEKQAKEMRQSREGRNQFLENLNSREKQIQAIEESFKASNLPPVHQTNRSLKPVKIMPLLPDFERYDDRFVLASFDGEPTADVEMYNKLDRSMRDDHESQAIMKSFVVSSSDPTKLEKFLAYMAPAPDELSKDIYDENEDISYCWVREYHWDVRGDDVDDPSTFLVNFDDDVARYLPLPTKLLLKKKKAKEGRSSDEVEHYPVPSRITVRKRASVAVTEVMVESGQTSLNHDRVDIQYSKKARSFREDDSDDRPERTEHFSGDDISE
ncbi:protein PAF1 homolog [Dendrobium catenatum]|uniref:Uncharacterized protein n=1 Tax=Dendrobium catenatum TaxID=906689 RepID=A0A2I0XDY5_9ASPA|nr:protein PAF1 homolog [Dendrobium catenatum]PKU86137.1 hypothetical protein MA16_Dca001968 [Dendrobium catenatum]